MKYLITIFSLIFLIQSNQAFNLQKKKSEEKGAFEIVSSHSKAVILYDKKGSPLDSIVANLLAEDIFKVTQYKPQVLTEVKQANGNVIVIGNIGSELIKTFVNKKSVTAAFLKQWESYVYRTVLNPNKKIKKAFVIAGTNARGTAFGVFDLSKKIGVSPWNWWSDVPVVSQKELVLSQEDFQSKPPSVKFRGIFLNDEDWGLQPWAAKTFEPETKDIGPKTYSKIFELLLRLKANTVWPAMHPSTKAFFHYPENAKMATLYEIVLGTSHAEPMLSNNVDEWNEKIMGRFNYKTNKDNVFKYWEDRVKEAKNIDGFYTIGMRGVHDSGMEGVKNNDEAIAVLNEVIQDQRGLLQKYINPDVAKVPQVFTVYKEVLDLYKNGLKVPDDITLVWTDDNYGYIRSLSNAQEQKRSGGAGVYYHISYWGRPHDYLWLSTTNPYLIQEEMMKAFNLNNKNIWILNVGDIKPAEYNTQLFMDMAFDAGKFQETKAIKEHQKQFYTEIFGDKNGQQIGDIQSEYYQLAFERKPEFMAWSQTEPTTPIFNTAYNPLVNGDEIQQRLDAYAKITQEVGGIEKQLPENLQSAFTQLVGYPVKASAAMNAKFLYRDKALVYIQQGRKSAILYKEKANEAYENIVKLTKDYNELNNGKWNGFMDMKPRKLPVFENPEINLNTVSSKEIIGVSVEDTLTTKEGIQILPTFYVKDSVSHFIDVFFPESKNASLKWKFKSLPNWIKASALSGLFFPDDNVLLEQRIQLSIDWKNWEKAGKPNAGNVMIEGDGFEKKIQLTISDSYANVPQNAIVEKNGTAVLYADSFVKNLPFGNLKWALQKGFGHSKSVMQAQPLTNQILPDDKKTAVLEYELFTETNNDKALLSLVAIPTHPLTTDGDVRVMVQWNEESIQMVNFKTEGRSKTWKENVFRNKAIQYIKVPIRRKGKQKLKIFMVDAGVLLDYMVLQTKQNTFPYKLPEETRLKN
ncbi:glycosyl hydrolase 115 family protein [Flavobacterium agrisoli]|uniref:Glycosyl hydrolase 115 family protein n=1 Tax=Flavobacterium agrisoli TaxID=2793066 RepID=A0A934UJU8_9FLAO|nr:glycosyl hydrolase 115 family protein [Flavobacterium agrisoli]MBK0369929.1 glycosyl hydrolase 115 family protein [Flavobacterium agrisoli]